MFLLNVWNNSKHVTEHGLIDKHLGNVKYHCIRDFEDVEYTSSPTPVLQLMTSMIVIVRTSSELMKIFIHAILSLGQKMEPDM